ncbi:hypothetical protein [Rhizobium sp. 16-488-2b]|jgi:hypothetical protein|uniref:hypothetical protein n=1 Tax=Rhizobium sp. 16-488-2b TaxID=2819991 RepID=UPI001ADD4643|nr:hypothetical protein [Rhizobium sp. 16-488-2b]MBO9128019.1 hypothetical protein [Rhizobium sp. 16-488-2b]
MIALGRAGIRLPIILGTAALLSGCLAPEEFNATIDLSGYSYSVELDGRLADPRYVKALQDGQEIPPDADEKMKGQEALAATMPGMERFVYVGEGRFDLAMSLEGELTESNPAIGFPATKSRSGNNFLTIERQDDGSVVISTPLVPKQALADLNSIGLPATGTVTVTVKGTVLEQNADEEAGQTYSWHRKSWEDRVYLKLDPGES